MKQVTRETAAKYAKYLKLEVDLEEYRRKMERALETAENMIEAAREAAK